MENPVDRKYSKEHCWIKAEGGTATVGITDFAQRSLKDIVFVELPEAGKQLEQGRQLCVLESVKSVSDIFAPVSGEVVEVNKELEQNPEKLNQGPFEAWIVKIRVKDAKELDKLLDAGQYSEYVKGLE